MYPFPLFVSGRVFRKKLLRRLSEDMSLRFFSHQIAYRNEDDLTVKLTEIILTNNMVKASLAKGTDMNTLMVSDWC